MYVHLVLIKWKPGVTRADPRVSAWRSLFAALEHKCAGVVRFEHGFNVTDRPVAYDYGINMAFATHADLVAYGPNADHQKSWPHCARSPNGWSATMKLPTSATVTRALNGAPAACALRRHL